jgi:hypothetical protein
VLSGRSSWPMMTVSCCAGSASRIRLCQRGQRPYGRPPAAASSLANCRYDGAVNDCFLVRTTRFDPRGALSDDELAVEHITGMRWWRHTDIAGYSGTDLFSPRDIATPLAALIAGDMPVLGALALQR